MYKFYLFHSSFDAPIRIEDPVGWDGLGKSILRDRTLHGITFEYTPRLKFIKKGKAIIHSVYEQYGVEGELLLLVRIFDVARKRYVEDYRGRVNYTGLIISTLFAEVNIENTGFLQKFLNRRDVTVDLLSDTSLDGLSITPPAPEVISLHSKVLKKVYDVPAGLAGSVQVNDENASPGIVYITIALETGLDEIEERYSYPLGISIEDPTQVDKYNLLLKEGGQYDFDLNFNFQLSNNGPESHDITATWYLKAGDNAPVSQVLSGSTGSVLGDVTLQGNFILQKNDPIYLYAAVDLTDMASDSTFFLRQTVFEEPLQVFKVTADTITPATNCPVLLPHEAFTQMVAMATGSDGAFYSDYFGRTDLGYSEDGPGALRSTTMGKHLRGFPLEEYSLFGSFELYRKSLDVTDSIGVGIERASDGRERVRIEQAPYFYQAKLLARFSNVLDVEKSVDESQYYNELEIGFKKWANEEINNLDEFLTKRQHVLPVTQVKRKLSLISEIIGSGYTIEFVRRDRYTASNTKDNDQDNDSFFVQLRRDMTGYITDRDQDYDQVTGLISPESSYNLKLRISEMILRRKKQLATGLYLLKKEIMPTFSEGNDNLAVQEDGGELLSDNRIIDSTDLSEPIFIPEVYRIKVSPSYDQKVSIESNPYGYLEFSATEKNYMKGYILKGEPDQKTRITTFDLLKARL